MARDQNFAAMATNPAFASALARSAEARQSDAAAR
jgi:hypothetical protein